VIRCSSGACDATERRTGLLTYVVKTCTTLTTVKNKVSLAASRVWASCATVQPEKPQAHCAPGYQQHMLNRAEPYSNALSAAPSEAQAAVQASLGTAHNYIAQGNITAALQVRRCVIAASGLQAVAHRLQKTRSSLSHTLQVVFEALRTVCGDTAAQAAASRLAVAFTEPACRRGIYYQLN